MGAKKSVAYFIGFIIFLIPTSATFLLMFAGLGVGGFVLFIIFLIPTIIFWKKHKANEVISLPYYDTSNFKNERTYPKGYNPSEQKPKPLVNENDLQDGFSKFSWRQMEELTGKLFEKKGYSVEVTKSTGDYGIDVWAKKDGMTIGIQVKKWRKDVGFDDVAKTLGSNMSKANKYILISTTSFFTPQAWEHQRQHSTIIELWDTNKFRQELRENLTTTDSYNKQVTNNSKTSFSTSYNKGSNKDDVYHTPAQDITDAFDYDHGFNIDEVYNQSEDNSPMPMGQKCTKCGSLNHGNVCGNCGKEISNA